MDTELREIAEFVASCPPFDLLPAEEIRAATRTLTQRYHRRGTAIVRPGDPGEGVQLIRSGAVEICDPDGTLLDTRDVGDCFGYSMLREGTGSRYLMVAAADTLAVLMPRAEVERLSVIEPRIGGFFASRTDRIRTELVSARVSATGGDPLATTVAELLTRPAVTVESTRSVGDAARVMSESHVSSVLVTAPDPDGGEAVVGIVSDRDLRTRVVAVGLDTGTPVAEVMTADPVMLPATASAFEATVTMMRHGVRHLPVLDGARAVGVVSSTGLLRLAQADPVYLAAHIARAGDTAAIAALMGRLPAMVVEFSTRRLAPGDVQMVVTATVDAAVRRLVELAEEALGPPPMGYGYVALGSQARGEMGVASDQDSALVLAAEPDAAAAEYFALLADRVREGLTAAGVRECPGAMMASNPRWRMSTERWCEEVATWIARPEAEHVLESQIFFDMRTVAGSPEPVHLVREHVRTLAPASGRFLAHLAHEATRWQPPLGFFRGLVVEKRGRHRNTLDVKAGGLAPVVQLARLRALESGSDEVGTVERLRAAAAAGAMADTDVADLLAAFDCLRGLQLQRHGECLAAGEVPDNHLDPTRLGSWDRHRLREAFGVIADQQKALGLRHPTGQM